jgi:transcriptional regulator with XRE-family HTH domain
LSREELSIKIDIDKRTIGNWEGGFSYPSMRKIIKIMQICDADPNYLFTPFVKPKEIETSETINRVIQICQNRDYANKLDGFLRALEQEPEMKKTEMEETRVNSNAKKEKKIQRGDG